MAEAYLGEIRSVGFDFAPRGWALCDGQLLSINQNQALFSLLGTVYGGDGRTTFALPDLRGRAAMHIGVGRPLGARGGAEQVTLATAQIPSHTHPLSAAAGGEVASPAGGLPAVTRDATYAPAGPPVALAAASLTNAGGGQSHDNMGPYLAVNYIIALQGIFPARN